MKRDRGERGRHKVRGDKEKTGRELDREKERKTKGQKENSWQVNFETFWC